MRNTQQKTQQQTETTSCRHCGNPISMKTRLCPHCGAEHKRRATKGNPQCPRCSVPLDEKLYRGSQIKVCPRCDGLWLYMEDFEFHTAERDTYSDPSIPRTFRKPAIPDDRGYLRCVHCDNVMLRMNFRKISGVIIDVCKDHGVWFDAGELEMIRCFVAAGGLDKSQDKAIRANSEEIARVAGDARTLKTFMKILHKWNRKRILLQGF